MQYLKQKKFPKDIADLICEYLPAHPMKAKIMHWSITRSRETHFHKWYFSGVRYKDFMMLILEKFFLMDKILRIMICINSEQ